MGITRPALPIDLLIPMGEFPTIASVNKFGANPSSTVGSDIEVWDGSAVYVFPTTADITSISQTTDQLAMRGATIEVQGLDANWDEVTQNVTLDATLTTTVVALTTPLIRVFRAKVLANVVGNSDIRIHNSVETQDYAIITAGNNQTLMAIYTVPNGKTAYITQYICDVLEDVVAGKDPDATEFKLLTADRDNGYEFQVKHSKGAAKDSSSPPPHNFRPYLKVTQKSDIKITANCTGRAGNIRANFDMIIIDN